MARLMHDQGARTPEDFPPTAVVGSLGLHLLLLVFVIWGAARVALPTPRQVYRVDLVAAPREAPVREMPVPQVQRPKPELKQEMKSVPTEPVAVERPQPERRTATEERKQEEAPKTEEEPPEPERAPAAATEAEEGAAELPVRLEGAPFPYPEYLENIIIQIRRHWRPPAGGRHLRAELAFTIEAAGRRGAFGPLPEGYPGDQLRVSFFFDPSRY